MIKTEWVTLHIIVAMWANPMGNLLSAQVDSVKKVAIDTNADLLSRYIWRGQDYSNSPCIQPDLELSWKALTFGSWGSYKFAGGGTDETDLYLSATSGIFTFAIWDYWYLNDTSFTDFFNYNRKTTNHLLEAQVLLSGKENLPFSLLGSYFFYGADKSGSIYLELQYKHAIGPAEMLFFIGVQPKGNYYAPKKGIVNFGCTGKKSIDVTDRVSLPVSISFILNPFTKIAYLVASLSI